MASPKKSSCRRAFFLGPKGTYSHQAAAQQFPKDVELVPKDTISGVFENVSKDEGSLGVVPLANSYFGPVKETERMRTQHPDLHCMTTFTLKIQHSIMRQRGTTGNVSQIMSHEQALGQCHKYLDRNYFGVERVSVESTATAALAASKDSGILALASEICAEMYDLEVLERAIQDSGAENQTTFIVLAKNAGGG